jgi:hypothetical protein
MTSMKEFMLDMERVSDGIKLPLFDRDGNLTDHWIQVRSMYCDEFQKLKESAKAKYRANPDAETEDEAVISGLCELVADWSFEEECNPVNVRAYLDAAPHIADQIDRLAGKHGAFFTKREPSSLNGQKSSSRSKNRQAKTAELSATT